jgi:hypothetical protein
MVPDMDAEQLSFFERMKDMTDTEIAAALSEMEDLGLDLGEDFCPCAPELPHGCICHD